MHRCKRLSRFNRLGGARTRNRSLRHTHARTHRAGIPPSLYTNVKIARWKSRCQFSNVWKPVRFFELNVTANSPLNCASQTKEETVAGTVGLKSWPAPMLCKRFATINRDDVVLLGRQAKYLHAQLWQELGLCARRLCTDRCRTTGSARNSYTSGFGGWWRKDFGFFHVYYYCLNDVEKGRPARKNSICIVQMQTENKRNENI